MALDHQDIRLIKGMLKRGDKQSDIASFFGCNGGRIAEINTGQKHAEVGTASPEELPPPGPYMAARSAYKAVQTLEALRDLVDDALKDVRKWERTNGD
jgi:hypothetical protein